MSGINKAILIGNLGRDPEVRYTQDGRAMVNFSLATTEKWKNRETGELMSKTEWHRIVAFGRLGEICGQWLSKGKQVYIEGKIQTREWEDRDGNKRYTTEILASEMRMLGLKGDSNRDQRDSTQGSYGGGAPRQMPQPSQTPRSQEPPPDMEIGEPSMDDIPF